MGQKYFATCNSCGTKFAMNIGGGFIFHLLHCNLCGEEKEIGFDELGEIHLRYIKGLDVPYCIATSESDAHIQKYYPGKPLSDAEYHSMVEEYAGKCNCGGMYKFEAKPRCPSCKSADYTMGECEVFYD